MRETAPKFHQKDLRNERLFARIAEQSDRLLVNGGRVEVIEPIDTPYDEFGIVDKKELFRRILGSVSTDFYWGGSYVGPHHIMWPQADYAGEGLGARRKIPMKFRSSQSLRVIIPRDLHDYLHKITEPPKQPGIDTMEQYYQEQQTVLHLYDIVRYHGLSDLSISEQNKEQYRLHRLHDELGRIKDGQVGLLPDRELLASMELNEVRQTLRRLARVQGLSNDPACQEAFFREG